MKDMLLKLWVKAQIFGEDNGQDLIEYALIAALLALAASATMKTVGTTIAGIFTSINTKLTNAPVG